MSSQVVVRGPKLTVTVTKTQLARLETDGSVVENPLDTPSSTVVEYGDTSLEPSLSARDRADEIFRVHALGDHPFEDHDCKESPVAETPRERKDRGVSLKLLNERLARFLSSLGQATGDPDNGGLTQMNRGLHRRIATLKRNEEYLVKDNQDLNASLKLLRQSRDESQRLFEDRLRREKAPLEARIRELERRLAEQNERLLRVQSIQSMAMQVSKPVRPMTVQTFKMVSAPTSPRVPTSLSDADMAVWFRARTASWSAWVDEFGHRDPNRIPALHPLQQLEVQNGVRDFVRLTDDGKVPRALTTSESTNPARLLLQGMLTNFIVSETLASPFWVFAALSKQGFDVESPRPDAPIGFRIDLAANVGMTSCPTPSVIPATARSMSILSPGRTPPVIRQMELSLLNTRGLTLQYHLPRTSEMQDLMILLQKTQPSTPPSISTPGAIPTPHSWRADLMTMLHTNGLTLPAPPSHSTSYSEEAAMLCNARLEYARALKDRFLCGAARFLLHDQDASGISRLENTLMREIDAALQFSVRAWARPGGVEFLGLKELAGGKPDGRVTELFLALQSGDDMNEKGNGQEVVMVLQPAVGTRKKVGGPGEVWVKAQVAVAAAGRDGPDENMSGVETAVATPEGSVLSVGSEPDRLHAGVGKSDTPKVERGEVMLGEAVYDRRTKRPRTL